MSLRSEIGEVRNELGGVAMMNEDELREQFGTDIERPEKLNDWADALANRLHVLFFPLNEMRDLANSDIHMEGAGPLYTKGWNEGVKAMQQRILRILGE